MFRINENEELTPDKISRIVQSFMLAEMPKLQRYYDYYGGKQDILKKFYADPTKPCNKIVKNYCNAIVSNFSGYLTGVPITYDSVDDIESLIDILNYNDYKTEDSELLKNALIAGVGYEICWIDGNAKERFKVVDSRECIPVYDDTINQDLLYMIRVYKKPTWIPESETKWIIEVYDAASVKTYESNLNFSSLLLLDEVPHYFKDVPFVEFPLNAERESIFAQIMRLQDAYNELISSEVDDFQAFTDAYLILKGIGMDAEDLPKMRENRVLIMDADDSAEYLTKNISDTQIENMLQNINDSIHVIANSPDFNDDRFMSTSGIAMKFKLTGFENKAAAIAANMTKAIQRRIELLYNVMGLIAGDAFADVSIEFTRNLPVDINELVNEINGLRGLVSDKTLLGLLPFVSNVEEELETVAAQKKDNASLYSFPLGGLNE